MEISIDHPTGRPNFTEVTLGELTVWFSYRTPVGYMVPGEGRVVRENEWGPTTGRHLNEIDRGDKAARLPGYVFRGRLDAHLSSIGTVSA